ncbi:MAG: Jag N-terminal domain-containing protein, partial [Desulfobacterales bacterium]|nr:Jag N-terminal domain-containing protein [Desulfobacterales bacterium]MDD3951793.1 Jag N-terminal domain-containing protein [Desulfobacterales bacterium]
MTPWIEFEGRNIDVAVENACQKLGKSKSELKYDVVSYGSTGIFGLVGVK